MEVLINDIFNKMAKIQIEHQYKNKNSEHSRCIRRHLHIVVMLGGAGALEALVFLKPY